MRTTEAGLETNGLVVDSRFSGQAYVFCLVKARVR